jgi:PUA domain protein
MEVKIKNRHRLKRKDIKIIQNQLDKTFNCKFFDETSNVETGEIEGVQLFFINDEPVFINYEGRIIFTLNGLNKYKPKENFVVVDMGAVKFVTSGADVMAPGVVDADKKICEDDQVWVCDQKHHKPLAVGLAIMNGEKMITEKRGKSVKIIHYVGDRLWSLTAKSL